MKYNPKINEETARLPGFAWVASAAADRDRPGQPGPDVQLQEWLKEISGFAGVTLQPAAGAQGELIGVLIIRAYHQSRGDTNATKSSSPILPTAPIRPLPP